MVVVLVAGESKDKQSGEIEYENVSWTIDHLSPNGIKQQQWATAKKLIFASRDRTITQTRRSIAFTKTNSIQLKMILWWSLAMLLWLWRCVVASCVLVACFCSHFLARYRGSFRVGWTWVDVDSSAHALSSYYQRTWTLAWTSSFITNQIWEQSNVVVKHSKAIEITITLHLSVGAYCSMVRIISWLEPYYLSAVL